MRKNKGFTLIEMIVAITMLAIILALTVSGLMAWQDWANFKKENEYAQTLFVAAQNQLTEYSATGKLQMLQQDFEGPEGAGYVYTGVGTNITGYVSNLINGSGNAYDLDTLFPQSQSKDSPTKYQDEIVSLRATGGDYAAYLSNPQALHNSNPSAYWVFELLGSYVYDTSILNGVDNRVAICIEMTPKNGQVFSVLYTDQKTGFVYNGMSSESAEAGSVVDISNRTEDYRYERMVGYYGVDTLYAATTNEVVQPSLAFVKLYNRDTFYMTYRLSSKYTNLTSSMDYVMDLDNSKSVSDKRITITLPAKDASGAPNLKNEANAKRIDCQVSRYEGTTEVPIGTYKVLAWVEPDYTVHVVWDAADIQATTELYNRELKDIRSVDKSAETKFANTYSFFRFGVDVDNVYASVMAKCEGYTDSKIVSNFGNLNPLRNQTEKHPCFANGKTKEEADGKELSYSITNARHLYNVRYIEDLTYEKQAVDNTKANSIKSVDFSLKDDIDWKQFQLDQQLYNSTGAIDLSTLNGKIYDVKGNPREQVNTKNCDFPSIMQLRRNDSFDGNNKEISGVNVSEISNALYGLYIVRGSKDLAMYDMRPSGVVNINYGQIKDLNVDKIAVSGVQYVGGIVGVNVGTVDKLKVNNTKNMSLVRGKQDVGGVLGFHMPTQNDSELQNLTNYAKVQGVNGVGGILGVVRNEYMDSDFSDLPGLSSEAIKILQNPNKVTITVSKCENYGPVEGKNASEIKGKGIYFDGSKAAEEKDDPRYIGGIAGYTYNKDENKPEKILITKCSSTPQYENEDLMAILSNDAALEKHLKGSYVGGIVGYNYYSQINECSTSMKSKKEGYIFGYRYVGGIVGMNIGPSSGIIGAVGTDAGINENHVIAYEYAGGIVGCNADVQDVDSLGNRIKKTDPEKIEGILLPSSKKNLHVKIDNWTNKGVVIATNKYAGGITGYNAGWIYHCNSVVDTNSLETYFEKLHSGDYAGGVSGYNNGVIGNTPRNQSSEKKNGFSQGKLSTTCYVRGRNYVGGIVGYNDENAIIEDYEIASGYVYGDAGSHFVGGYAGLNASVDLMMDTENNEARHVYSNPNRVEGTYFVGGSVGGNVINTSEYKHNDVYAMFKSDSFLGTLNGHAFVGGFVGYNLLFNEKNPAEAKDEPNKIVAYTIQKKIVDAFEESDAGSGSTNEKLKEKVNILENVKTTASGRQLLISGESITSTTSAFGAISGDIYVGGVLGYNDNHTKLYLKHVENASAVLARTAIENDKEQVGRTEDYAGNPFTYTYSYAGGIIGKVSANTTVDNCYNAHSGSVKTYGTYTGGLCEVNEGRIINCKISNFGNGVDDYIGGLCGLNKALIENCESDRNTVAGRNVVSMVAAENFGTIKKITLNHPRVNASGKASEPRDGVTGIYAGFNGSTGVIELENDIEHISIKSDGSYVGAVAGINEGTVVNKKSQTDSINNNLTIAGNIEGYYDVGGLFGLNRDVNESHVVSNYTNNASIIAVNGNAGGIIGENASSNTIRYCENDAVVSATVGDAGGITSRNSGEIANCYNYKSVSAPKGMCGGITAVNGSKSNQVAVIKNCFVKAKSTGLLAKKVTFTSTKSVGGITAWNYGVVQNNKLENIVVTNSGVILHTSIGVVAGDNKSTGKIYLKGNAIDIVGCKAIATTNNCNVGGVAGTNDGLIANKKSYEAGEPTDGYALIGVELSLDGAKYASLGGVAGLNTGIIGYCQVDASIEGDLGTASTGYGGIAGYSGYTEKSYKKAKKEAKKSAKENKDKSTNKDGVKTVQIIGCTYDGELHVVGSAGNPANGGGIAGVNGYGSEIRECIIGAREKNFDGEEALATSVTAGDMSATVAKPDNASYAYIGGISGRNYGTITAIDLYNTSKDTSIEVVSFGGSAGGMVGFQYPGASVTGYKDEDGTIHWVTTPGAMHVEMRRGENDYGPGGVIGYDKAWGKVEYVKNYAHVENYVNLNVKAGGIIGTLEQQDNPFVEFSHCENYGTVEGLKQIGGLLGRTKFCSVRMTDCSNYGEVKATDGSAGGLIARIYDIKESEAFFTRCNNHGYVHIDFKSGTNYAGGLLGNFDSSTNIKAYFYDCDNTGLVAQDNKDVPTINIGSFLGSGDTATTYFEKCQNYNTAPSANGFVGNKGIVKIKDCIDNSGVTTTSNGFSPFLSGGVTVSTTDVTKSSVENSYYLDEESKNATPYNENGGAYFTFDKSTNYDLYWSGNKFQNLQNPALYLTAPTPSANIQQANDRKFEMHLAYDKSKCVGIDSMNFYLWNGSLATATAEKIATYTITATFTDVNGNKDTAVGSVNKLTNQFDVDKITIQRPASLNAEIKDIEIHGKASTGNMFYRGFTYVPVTPSGVGTESVCTYISEKNDTAFDFTASTNGTVKKGTDGIKVHGIYNLNELLGLGFEDYEWFQFNRASATTTLELDFDVKNGENASGMKAFVMYPANNNASATTAPNNIRTYYYDYVATFTDKNGNSASVTGTKATNNAAMGYDGSRAEYHNGTVIDVPAELDKQITHVNISFTGCVYTTSPNGIEGKPSGAQNNFYFHGFGWIPSGETQAQYLGVGERPIEAGREFTSINDIKKLYCDYSENGTADIPYVYTAYNYNEGFNMTKNDPVKDVYYADEDSYEISDSKADGSDSRIKVYKDLHDKFTTWIQEQATIEKKLDTPKPVAVEKNGKFYVTWDAVKKAYEYEVKYVIKNQGGKTVYESDIYTQGSGNRTFITPILDEWEGYTATFYVRAVNGYRYTGNDSSDIYKYDSDWGTGSVTVKTVLPQPIVHMELTAGNKMIAILENRSKFKVKNTDNEYMDCLVNITYGTDTFTIPVKDGFISSEAKYLSGHTITTDYTLTAQAMPTTETVDLYSDSLIYNVRGHFVDNAQLLTRSQYVTTYFRGFYGDQADNMTYNVYYASPSGYDCFIKSDILAYDKDLEMNISYSTMSTHVASTSGTANFTAVLSDLPMEWFAEDFENPIVVREYLKRSQYEVVHYEHVVKENIKLDGATAEENKAILSGIVDPYYLSANDEEVLIENYPVWDFETNNLKDGYTLQLRYDANGEKVYDLYYNASIELAKKAAGDMNATLEPGKSYVYYNHCVDYKYYTATKNDTVVSNHSLDPADAITVKTAKVNLDDYQESYLVKNVIDKTHMAVDLPTKVTNLNVQEMQPAPIIDGYTEDIVDGHRSFTFSFDEYYKDKYCMTVNNTAPDNKWYTKTNTQYMTYADGSVANTWDAFLKKTDYLTNTNNTTKMRMMNAYYYSYINAKYRVDLIGKTLEGEEAVIATTTDITLNRLEDMTNSYVAENKTINAIYERYNHLVTFTDTDEIWNNYSDFTIRVMRLGSLNGITNVSGINVPTITKITNYNGAEYILPKYSDYNIHVKMKFNTINNPAVNLHKEDGKFETDSLRYDVTFGGLTNEHQLDDLGGYLITAKLKTPAEDDQVTDTHYYYVPEMKDGIVDTIGLNLDELSATGTVIALDPTQEYEKIGDSRLAIIDLSDFNTDDEVEISIKAIARTNAVNYEDGLDGTPTVIKILERLLTPDVSKIKIDDTMGMTDLSLTDGGIVDMTTYKKGMYYSYGNDTRYSGTDYYSTIGMEMAIAVYDAPEDFADTTKNADTSGWCVGARKVLYAKDKPLSMGYIKNNNKTLFDLAELETYTGLYAGKWLKIALRATCKTKINSPWTDQDKDGESVNYKWIQIPNVKLDDVNAEETEVTRYEYNGVIYNAITDVPEEASQNQIATITSKALQFKEDRNLAGYGITLVGKSKIEDTPEGPVTVTPAYQIEIVPHVDPETGIQDGTYEVAVAVGGEQAIPCGMLGVAYGDATGVPEQIIEIPAIADVLGGYNMNLQVRYTPGDKSGMFTIVLPDIDMVGETSVINNEDYFSIVDVMVMPKPSASLNHVVGQGTHFFRQKDEHQVWLSGVNGMDLADYETWRIANADLFTPPEPQVP